MFEPERVGVACGVAGHHELVDHPSLKALMGLILTSNENDTLKSPDSRH